tara:strand:- start:23712 stop:24824 length:1113 start_codon:yes stop_codon:yes gene_type:complete
MASKQPSTQIKVCLVAISLGRGGAERSTALLSRMLREKGFQVSIVILNDVVGYPYEGKLFNLGALKTKPDTLSKRLARFKKLKTFFKEEEFDYIIDTRSRGSVAKELFYLHYLYKEQRIIYVVHSFNISQYFPKQQWIVQKMIDKAEAVIGVSKAISKKINTTYNTQKTVTIYNPSEPFSETEAASSFSEKYILYLGRIEEKVKNFTLLLEGYKASKLSGNNVHLKIVGDGPDVDFVQHKIDEMSISETVTLYPFTSAILPYVKNALYLTLTSRYEGFPMVLIEALSVGTPVISVDCKSGPDEIIINQKNGLLIENHSVEALAEAMNRLAFDTELYKTCKTNAQDSISHLKMDAIGEQWANLLNNKQTRS